jgi:Carboxypeptidase regulatory-like domain
MFRLTRIVFTGIINLLFFAIVCAQEPSNRTASISGRVTVNGKPSGNALVTAVEVEPKVNGARIIQSNGREFVDRLGYKTATDADGSYLFTSLPAGRYKISALSPAYLPEDRDQFGNGERQITLDQGEAREQVDFALIRGGVITGRVTDAENRPQIRVRVKLTLLLDNGQENGVWRERQTFETDDRGIYRVYGLRAGRYIVGAGGKNSSYDEKFDLTYHPNTTDAAQARVIEVKDGGEVAGIDIKLMTAGKTYEVLGRLIEAETGKAVPEIRVFCQEVTGPEDNWGSTASSALSDIQGNFRITGVRPGKYKAMLCFWDGDDPFYTEGKYFEINSENATGIELTVKRGGTVSGVAVLEGGKDRYHEAKLYQAYVSMSIRPDADRGYQLVASNHTGLSPDGSFRFVGLPPGKLNFTLGDSKRSLHLIRVERDGVAQPDGIDVSPGEDISGVKLIVAHGDGAIRGEVKVTGGTLPENSNLSIRAVGIGSTRFDKDAKADGKGRFLIEGLLAGEYRFAINYWPKPGMSTYYPVANQTVYVTSGAESSVILTLKLNQQDQ